jgi:hypothetical protein
VDVLNPWMLFGLTALAVPILIHLLSRRRQEVVDWGAMQFLEPSPKARRSLFIENLILLLVRMALVAIVACALARPWLQWPWLARWISSRPQDVAVVLDGSYSLDRRDGPRTLADRLRRTAKEVFAELDASDALQVYDARETPLPVLSGFQRDKSAAWETVLDLPPVSGSADLVSALTMAAQDLVQGTTLDRDIVVLTDSQTRSWRLGDSSAWEALQTAREQSAIKPRIWVLTVSPDDPAPPVNVAVTPIELSRELLPVGSRVRIEAKVRALGNAESLERDVQLEIDGRPSGEHKTRVRVPPNGEAPVSFELAFDKPGCRVLSVVLTEDDDLPADNRAHAVVEVGQGWPVLLVDGAPHDDPTKAETFFLAAALEPSGSSGWLSPTVTPLADWTSEVLGASAAVVLANINALSEEQAEKLDEYLNHGGAVLVTLGDQAQPTNADEPSILSQFLALDFIDIGGDPLEDAAATALQAESLELPWQQRFRRQRLGGIAETRFRQWWRVAIRPDDDGDPGEEPRVLARFATNDAALIGQRRGRGILMVWTSTIDADWNQLPARPDYVAWWHELLLSMIVPTTRRNVSVGEPLLALGDSGQPPLDGEFLGPWSFRDAGEPTVLGDRGGRRLSSARWPGVYVFASEPESQPGPLIAAGALRDAYAVRCAVEESDLTPLSADERAALERNHEVRFVDSPAELGEAWLGDAARLEFAPGLLYLLLAFLIVETWLTRRMVKRGSADSV